MWQPGRDSPTHSLKAPLLPHSCEGAWDPESTLNQPAGPDILCWCVPPPRDQCLSADRTNCAACTLSRSGKRAVAGDLAANMTLILWQLNS